MSCKRAVLVPVFFKGFYSPQAGPGGGKLPRELTASRDSLATAADTKAVFDPGLF